MSWWGWFFLGFVSGTAGLVLVGVAFEEWLFYWGRWRNRPATKFPHDQPRGSQASRDVAETDDKFHGFIRWK